LFPACGVYDVEDAFLAVDYGGLADAVVRCGFMCSGEVVEAELVWLVTYCLLYLILEICYLLVE
jgi:hypothetical protein